MKTINSTVLAFAVLLTAGSLYAEKEASKTNTEKITLQERAKHVALGSLTGASALLNLIAAGVLAYFTCTEPTDNPPILCVPLATLAGCAVPTLGKSAYRSFVRAFRKSKQRAEKNSKLDLEISPGAEQISAAL